MDFRLNLLDRNRSDFLGLIHTLHSSRMDLVRKRLTVDYNRFWHHHYIHLGIYKLVYDSQLRTERIFHTDTVNHIDH